MKLPYERFAIAALSAMITTLAITTTARYANSHLEHQIGPMDYRPAVPKDRCPETTLTEEANAIIRTVLPGS